MSERTDSLSVSNPLGIPHTNSQFASRAAFSMSSRVAVEFPYAMFEAMVPVNKMGSWGTIPITLRHESTEKSRMSGKGECLETDLNVDAFTLSVKSDLALDRVVVSQQ